MTADIYHFSQYAVLEFDKTFTDVGSDHWASTLIKNLAAQHIINGINNTEFAPNASVTRAEFAALLVRSLKIKALKAAKFTDIDASQWYASEVAAASEAGIVTGRSATVFAPNDTITREEMVVMLIRAYEHSTGSKATVGNSASFADQATISAWAQDAVKAAQSLGFIIGREDNQFVPQGVATRAESAQIISKLIAE